MKKQLTILILISLLMTTISCSSEDSAEEQESFTYKYDNNNVDITQWEATKNGDRFVIQAMGSEQIFAIEFNKYGNLSSANSYSTSNFNFPLSQSFIYYSSYSFNFDIDNIDTGNKMIKASFDGLLYEDNYDITSPTHEVSGQFNLKYTEVPQTELTSMDCKINNHDWHATNTDESSNGQGEQEVSFFNDDEHIINLYFNFNDITTCHNTPFTQNSDLRIQLSIYDPINDEMIDCESTGTISITNITPPSGLNYGSIEGDFTMTATNPENNQSYNINNGHFKYYYY